METLAQFGSIFFLFEHGVGYRFKEQREFNQVAVGGCLLSMAIISVTVQASAAPRSRPFAAVRCCRAFAAARHSRRMRWRVSVEHCCRTAQAENAVTRVC